MPTMLSKNRSSSLKAFLEEAVSGPERHARFLNTLSFLEHLGSRKIFLSHRRSTLPGGVLQHLAEETRHASFFRKHAERIGGRAVAYVSGDMLALASSRFYFARLDALVTRLVGGDQDHPYYYVSLAIERRALELYGLYEEILGGAGRPLTLKGLLAEERRHLVEMEEALLRKDPRYPAREKACSEIEGGLFERWLSAVSAA